MFAKLRQMDTEEELYDVALRALMRRAHSVQEMKKLLSRRTRNELLVQLVVARLKESGQLDDARYARQFARQRWESRKQGKFRITRELRARGVSDGHIEAAVKESSTEEEQTRLIRRRIEGKLKLLRGEIDERKIASLYGSLLRAGFPSDLVRRELRRLSEKEIPDAEDPAPE